MPRRFPDDEGFDKVNFVIDSWTTGCDAPWYIYIETMGPAALEAFIVLLSFGWADVVRGRLRPKGLGRRSGKRKGKWARRLPRFPEIGNTLGKSLPVGEQLEDFIKWGNKTRFLWRIDNLFQALYLGLLVVDVAEDFAFNWTTLLYHNYWCEDPGKGRFSYRVSGMALRPGNTWWREAFGEEDFEVSPPSWGYTSGGTGGVDCVVFAALTIEKIEGEDPPTELKVRVINQDTLEVLGTSELAEADPDGNATVALKLTVKKHIRFRVQSWNNAAWCKVGNGFVAAFEV